MTPCLDVKALMRDIAGTENSLVKGQLEVRDAAPNCLPVYAILVWVIKTWLIVTYS